MSQYDLEYNGMRLRAATQGGELWCAAVDLCRVLDLCVPENTHREVERLEPGERAFIMIEDRLGRPQKSWAVNEAGTMKMICMCRHGYAQDFKAWIRQYVYPVKKGNADIQLVEHLLSTADRALDMAGRILERDAV